MSHRNRLFAKCVLALGVLGLAAMTIWAAVETEEEIRFLEKAFPGARLCRIEGMVVFPEGVRPAASFDLDAEYTYYIDTATGKWKSVSGPGTRLERNLAAPSVAADGVFQLLVPQASTVTFWRTYDLGEPSVPYVVPPTVVQIPLGKATLRAELQATVPPGADRLFTFKGRVLSAETNEPIAGLVMILEQKPKAAEATPGMVTAQKGDEQPRKQRPSIQQAKSDAKGDFSFTVPKMPGYDYVLRAEPPSRKPEQWQLWKRAHVDRLVQIADIEKYESEPFVWVLPARTATLVLEYRTTYDLPMPLPPGKNAIYAGLRTTEKPVPTTETKEDGLVIEHRYELIKEGGHEYRHIQVYRKDGKAIGSAVGKFWPFACDVSIQRAPDGRAVQHFYGFDRPGQYEIYIDESAGWLPIQADRIIEFEPRPGEPAHKVIRVEPRTEKAQPAPDAKP